jgi:hypothetical protein
MEEINEESSIENTGENTSDEKPVNVLVEMRKTWRDYVFEFTLPFLAVMAAFFLNTERENYVERNLEKQYIKSMINDINDDAKLIDEQIAFHKMRIEQMDSLMEMLENPNLIQNFDRMY